MAKERDGISSTRKRIEEAMQRAEHEKVVQSTRKRLEYAIAGVKANETQQYVEAVKNYHAYLKILEEAKGVSAGGLYPAHFDKSKDMAELLLLVGVYWDMAKIYDRAKTAKKYTEFKTFLDKFVLFSKGMPHEPVCKELLRKYLWRSKATHGKEFRDAYQSLGGERCFVATSLIDVIDPRTLPALRRFRDERLGLSAPGRAFIAFYYRIGPGLAMLCDRLPRPARERIGAVLDRFARRQCKAVPIRSPLKR